MKRLFEFFVCAAFGVNLHAAPITALAFSPDGRTLASSGSRKVDFRSPDDAAVRESFDCDFPRVSALTYSRPGALLITGGTPGESGAAFLVDPSTKRVLRKWEGYPDLVTCGAFDATGDKIALGSASRRATIYWQDRSIDLDGHSSAVLAVAFVPSGQSVLTAGADCSIKLWNLEGKVIHSFNYHSEPVHALAIRPPAESRQFECASGSDDSSVRIWQPDIGRMVRIIRGHKGPVFALAYHPQGSALFSAGREGIVRQLDVESDRIIAEIKTNADAIYSLAVSADGNRIATGDWSGTVKLWMVRNGRLSPR